jgi:hypothetical protein
VRRRKSPGGRGQKGEVGEGVFRLLPTGLRDPWEAVKVKEGTHATCSARLMNFRMRVLFTSSPDVRVCRC